MEKAQPSLRDGNNPGGTGTDGGQEDDDLLFSQPRPFKSKLSASSREEIDVSKLTQAIFRKRMGNGRNGNKYERRYRKKKYETKKRVERVGTPLNSSGLMGGSSEKMSATKSGLKLEKGNEKQLSNNFENVKQLLDQISSPVPSAPQRKKSQQKIPREASQNSTPTKYKRKHNRKASREDKTEKFSGFENGNNLSGWDVESSVLSPTSSPEKNYVGKNSIPKKTIAQTLSQKRRIPER